MPSLLGAINSNSIATQTSFCQVGGPVSQTERPAIIKLTDNIQNDPAVELTDKIHNDAVVAYIKNPHQTHLALSAVLSGMRKDLPQPLIKADLSLAGERVKNLIGVIYSDVKNSNHRNDIKTLDNICDKLIAAHGNAEKECKIKGQLTGLVKKYGTPALERTINTFIDICTQAWQYDHDLRSINVENRPIFTADLDLCKCNLHDRVKDLNDSELAWESIGQKMNQFVDGCTAISKTMTFYNLEPASPAAGEPVRNSPAAPQAEPGNKPDVQSLTLPAGPGNGPITLHITNTSTGGSVGDINNSSGGAHSAQPGLSTADLKEILASDLDKTGKEKLTHKYLELIAGAQRFANKIESVGNLKPATNDGVPAVKPGEVYTSTLEIPVLIAASEESGLRGDVTPLPRRVASDEPDSNRVNLKENSTARPESKEMPLGWVRMQAQRLVQRAGEERTLTFTPGPGAFTGEAARGDRIVTSQPIHSHMNRKDPNPTHFNRPVSSAASDPTGTKKIEIAPARNSDIRHAGSSHIHTVTEEVSVVRHQNMDGPFYAEPVFIDSEAGGDSSISGVEGLGTANEPTFAQQDSVKMRQSPAPRVNEKQAEVSKKNSWQPAKLTQNAPGNTGNLTGYKQLHTTWRTVDPLNREPVLRDKMIPQSDGRDNWWIRSGNAIEDEDVTPAEPVQTAINGAK
jgi:hypothetical protein